MRSRGKFGKLSFHDPVTSAGATYLQDQVGGVSLPGGKLPRLLRRGKDLGIIWTLVMAKESKISLWLGVLD